MPLAQILEQVLAEMRSSQPDRLIDAVINIPDVMRVDATQVAQLLSDLLNKFDGT